MSEPSQVAGPAGGPAGTPEPFDLGILGGTLVDPWQGVEARRDVGFRDGRVAAVEATIDPRRCRETIDATGRLVVPGLIDTHTHVYQGVSHYGIDADRHCLARGVTTAIDAGSAGADTFGGFRRYVVEPSGTRLYAFLNISTMGMISRRIGELADPRWADPERTAETIQAHRDVLLGVKVRLTRAQVSERAGLSPLRLAQEAAAAAGTPVMVHPQDSWGESIDQVVDALREGDILTHTYHGLRHGVLDERGQIRRAVLAARDRGVHFDVGHGEGSFSFRVCELALDQGLKPRTISTDLHRYNVDGPVWSLLDVMSKFLMLGLPLRDIVERVTVTPARVIGRLGEVGTLAVGAHGDAAVLELRDGPVDLVDSYGDTRRASVTFACHAVVRAGQRLPDPAGGVPARR